MTFEEKIISNSEIRQRNLLRPAKIAFDKPDTGVTIVKKGFHHHKRTYKSVLIVVLDKGKV